MTEQFNADEFLSEIGVSAAESADDTPAIRILRKKIKDLGKAHNESLKTIAGFQAEKAKAAVESVWDELKVPAAVRGMYHGDQTSEAITSWWNDSKALFNLPADGAGQDGGQAATPDPQAQALAQVQQAANLGHDGQNLGLEAFQAKAAEVARSSPNKNPNGLSELFASMNIPEGGLTVPRVG